MKRRMKGSGLVFGGDGKRKITTRLKSASGSWRKKNDQEAPADFDTPDLGGLPHGLLIKGGGGKRFSNDFRVMRTAYRTNSTRVPNSPASINLSISSSREGESLTFNCSVFMILISNVYKIYTCKSMVSDQ